MSFIAYLPDALALLTFIIRRLVRDKGLSESLVKETAQYLSCSTANTAASEAAVRHVTARMRFEALRKDVQTSSTTVLAGIVARADNSAFLHLVVVMASIWVVVVTLSQTLLTPVEGVRERRFREAMLTGLFLSYLAPSVICKVLTR